MILDHIDTFLNSITMYRLVLWGVTLISVVAIIWAGLGWLPYSPLAMLASLLTLMMVCGATNAMLARVFHVPANVESVWITTYILFLLLWPASTVEQFVTLVMAGIMAMASKYVLAINHKHVFNPAAVAAVGLMLMGNGNVNWWVGSVVLLPVVTIVGLLVVRKIRRFALWLTFMATAVMTLMAWGAYQGAAIPDILIGTITSWPLIFFSTIMLTEPLTMPPRHSHQLIYAGLVGVLFGSPLRLGPVFTTPEVALVVGNLYTFLVSPRYRSVLTLIKHQSIAQDLHEFIFRSQDTIKYLPGQYLEWTLAHHSPDQRGFRRYFTIASSPTESTLRLAVKVPKIASSFKQALVGLQPGDTVVASQVAGDFVLPVNVRQPLVCIAGGIGITPFRSMIKYVVDTDQKREMILFYVNSTPHEFAYQDLFDQAVAKHGLTYYPVITRSENVPANWPGLVGYLTPEMITSQVPHYLKQTFYLSGPNAMVTAYRQLLRKLNVPSKQIVTDYFPGF